MFKIVATAASGVQRFRRRPEQPCPVCKLRLDTGTFAPQDLWKLGLGQNWKALKNILHPLLKPGFAVTDASSRMFVDRARRMFDKATDVDGDTIVRVIMVDQAKDSEAKAEILKLILEIGVDPDVPAQKHGFRPSHTCASFGLVDLVQVIFTCRPQMEAKNCNGDTPLQAAQRDEYKEDEEHPERKALRPLVAKTILEGMYESDFPSLAELASRKTWWAVKNLIRRRVTRTDEFQEMFGGKTAAQWAEHYTCAPIAAELQYYERLAKVRIEAKIEDYTFLELDLKVQDEQRASDARELSTSNRDVSAALDAENAKLRRLLQEKELEMAGLAEQVRQLEHFFDVQQRKILELQRRLRESRKETGDTRTNNEEQQRDEESQKSDA